MKIGDEVFYRDENCFSKKLNRNHEEGFYYPSCIDYEKITIKEIHKFHIISECGKVIAKEELKNKFEIQESLMLLTSVI